MSISKVDSVLDVSIIQLSDTFVIRFCDILALFLSVLKEHWIRAKYERKEFATQSIDMGGYGKGFMEGYLLKKGKKNGNFQKRKFILTQENGKFILKYFNKPVIFESFNFENLPLTLFLSSIVR